MKFQNLNLLTLMFNHLLMKLQIEPTAPPTDNETAVTTTEDIVEEPEGSHLNSMAMKLQ